MATTLNSSKEITMASSTEKKKTLTCRGAVCWGPQEPLTVEEIQVEPPRASEVRVRMLCASICHTDVTRWHGLPFPLFPRVLGHEGVGVVESVGEGVKELKEGDTVIPTFVSVCRECLYCTSGRTNRCVKFPRPRSGLMSDQTSRMSVKGQMLYHMFTCSTFCEFTVVNVNYVIKVDQRLPLPCASLLSCGFSTGFGMPWKEAKIEKGSTVAVFGLGGVGVGAIAGAHCMGASKIIGVDLIQNKKENAYAFGMTDFINPNGLDGRSISDAIREMTGGLGVNYCFDCSGAAPLNEAVEATIEGTGVTVIVGIPEEPTVPFSLRALVWGSKTLKGSIFGGIEPQSDMPTLIAKCVNKELQLDRMVTHKIALDDINDAFQLIKQPDCLKVCIEINGKSES